MDIREQKKIVGIALVIVGLTLFFICYNSGLTGQKLYSNLGCAVEYKIPHPCAIANNQMIGEFLGMTFFFFMALFGASLVVPSVISKLIWRRKAIS